MKKILLFLFIFLSTFANAQKHKKVLCPTPPMGWNSWNCFNKNISEEQIREIANLMVSTGLKDAGYTSMWMIVGRRIGSLALFNLIR